MPGIDPGLAGQHIQLLTNRFEQRLRVRCREVRASDRTGEERVPHHRDARALAVQRHAARRVPRRVRYAPETSIEFERLPILQHLIRPRLRARNKLRAQSNAQIQTGIGKPIPFRAVKRHGQRAKRFHNLINPRDVIDVRMGQDQSPWPQLAIFHVLDQGIRLETRIDDPARAAEPDARSPRILTLADDVAVGLKRPEREAPDRHPRPSSLCARFRHGR